MAPIIRRGALMVTVILSLLSTGAGGAAYQTRIMDNFHYRIFSDGYHRLSPEEFRRLHRSLTQARRHLFPRYGIPAPPVSRIVIALSSSHFRDVTGTGHEQGGIYLPGKKIFCFYRPGFLREMKKLDSLVYREMLRQLIYRARWGSEVPGVTWMEEAFCEARYPLFPPSGKTEGSQSFRTCREFKNFIRSRLSSPDSLERKKASLIAGRWGRWMIRKYGEKFLLERIIRGKLTSWMTDSCDTFLKEN